MSTGDGVTMEPPTKDDIDDETGLSPWTTTRNELWSYYLYYIGNNGLAAFNFGPSQFQNLLFLAGYDPTGAPFSIPCGDDRCVLPYLGAVRDGMCIRGHHYEWRMTSFHSKLHCPPHKWDQFRDSGSSPVNYRSMG